MWIKILMAGLISLPTISFAQEIEPSSIFPVSIKPCDFWTSSANARGYICLSYPRSIQVVEAREVQHLERRVRNLEQQLEELLQSK